MKTQYHLKKGSTLVELMITLVLSLLITYAIAQVLISSNRSSVTSDGMSQSQETGRFVMSFLAAQIRQAGLDSITNESRTTGAFISCSDFPALAARDGVCIAEGPGGETEITIDNAGTHGDRLAIAWIPPAGRLADCTGSTGHRPMGAPIATPLTPYAVDDIILNTFWVEPDADSGMNSLFCQGYLFDGADVIGTSTQQAIANGVEAMQILYGEAIAPLPDNRDRNVARYVPAPVDPEAPAVLREVQDWSRVYAVKVSILTRSLTDITLDSSLRSYILANAAPYDMTDAVSRQVFTTTFALNNYQ